MSRDRSVRYWQDGHEPAELSWTYDIHSDFSRAAREIADTFPRAAADLWEIAAACYAVDRRTRRPQSRAWTPGAWRRTLRIEIPVRERSLWERHRGLLHRLLAWITCDDWSLHFRDPRPGEIPEQSVQGRFEDPEDWPENRVAALFSGGMDSTAGILHEVTGARPPLLLAVSVATSTSMRAVQTDILERIRRPGIRLVSLPFRLSLRSKQPSVPPVEDNTQRSRGFVFLAAGVAAALTARCRRLRIYENGIGAINLPCTWGQLGAQAARPVHPRTITLMQRIADVVADAGERDRLTIDTPHLRQTKAQMIRDLPSGLGSVLAASVSCDTGFSGPRRKPALDRHCGCCSSCLLRRQALIVAGRTDLEAIGYRGPLVDKLHHLPAMLWQVTRMSEALTARDPWSALVQEFPDVLCVPSVMDEQTRKGLIDLYRRYCDEWSLPEVAQRLGFQPDVWGLQT